MGHYLNPNSQKFQMSLNSEIYIDKSELLIKTNEMLHTEDRFICISRPRRFGKTMGINMLATYYARGESTDHLFKNLKIENHTSYEKHLNQYNVLVINMQDFLSRTKTVDAMIQLICDKVTDELKKLYPEIDYDRTTDFFQVMKDTFVKSQIPFVILIDEWDCLFRIFKSNLEAQKIYLDFLRTLLKDQDYVGLAYMTGILPIKKYGTHSALNMFEEDSMTDPGQFLNYFGFTEPEVKKLSLQYDVDFEAIKKWYNGYFTDLENPIYSPKSVGSSLLRGRFSSYWNKTETFEALRDYIMLDFDGLKEKVTEMISGVSIDVDTGSFANDMATFASVDDVLTLLVHLGYLAYNYKDKTVRIPNDEVRGEFITSVRTLKWHHVIDSVRESSKLLEAIWQKNANFVAKSIEKVHERYTSVLKYNDENALSCVIGLALYSASDYYTIVRELPAGKGYADLVFIPRRKELDKPALVVELKWNKTAEGAISQIKERNYASVLEAYQGNLLLVGVNYDTETKKHACVIEEWKI